MTQPEPLRSNPTPPNRPLPGQGSNSGTGDQGDFFAGHGSAGHGSAENGSVEHGGLQNADGALGTGGTPSTSGSGSGDGTPSGDLPLVAPNSDELSQVSGKSSGSDPSDLAASQPSGAVEGGTDPGAHLASESAGQPAVESGASAWGGAAERDQLWNCIQEALQQHIQPEQFETWFRRAELRKFDGKKLVLAVQNGFTRYFITHFYSEVLERAVHSVVPGSCEIEFLVDAELVASRRADVDAPSASRPPNATDHAAPTGSRVAPTSGTPAPQSSVQGSRAHAPAPIPGGPERRLLRSSDVGLHQSYRFENFVVGPCNRFANAAAVGVSESPGQTYNPFFLHGNVGLGKTHLMQSLCHSLLDREPGTRILYLSCETFVNHFISALENGDLQEFRHKYRNVDVLVVDDIHILANKERTQEEFFHTFNTLYNAGKQIVLSSDSPPKDIPTLQGRLVSRFKWGLVTELEPPCYETRMAILKRKSRERGQEFPEEVARLLAEHIDSNIRELEGSVVKVIGYSNMVRQPVSPELVRECLPDLFERVIVQPTMEDVLRIVTEHFQIKRQELQSRRRTAAIAYARQVGMFLARRVTRLSLEEIGGFFGGRDHSTVLYAIQKIDKLIKSDATVLETVRQLEGRLGQATVS